MPLADDVTNPEEFAELCEEVKEGILEVLNATLIPAGPPVVGEKLPAIKNRRIIDRVPATFASKLSSDRHLEGVGTDAVKKVHIFMVGYGGIDTDVPSPTVQRKNFQLRFLIDSYYEDDIGMDEDNAEKRHAAEVHKVAYALFASRTLNRPGIVQRVIGFSERRQFSAMGENIVRESLGEVLVLLKGVPI